MPKETFFNLKAEKQERILRAAVHEFHRHGYAHANVGKIALSAEVAKGSMYQYFEDKKELFLYCVRWSVEVLVKLTNRQMLQEDVDMFEYFAHDVHQRIALVKKEKELALFTQDVFLGKFRALVDESIDEMMRVADEYVLMLIRNGKKKGTIRGDIDDRLLALFLTGTSLKMKEHILKEAILSGFDVTDDRMEQFTAYVEDFVELLRNGMGSKENGNSAS